MELKKRMCVFGKRKRNFGVNIEKNKISELVNAILESEEYSNRLYGKRKRNFGVN